MSFCDNCCFLHNTKDACPTKNCKNCDKDTCWQLACPPITGCLDCRLAGVTCPHKGVLNLCPCCGKPDESSMTFLGLTYEQQCEQKADFCSVNVTTENAVRERGEERAYLKRDRDEVAGLLLSMQRSAAKQQRHIEAN